MAGPESAGCHTRYSSEEALEPVPRPGPATQRRPVLKGSGRNPWAAGSFLYFIAIFVKHAFEGIGEGEFDLLPGALAVLD